LGSATPSLVAFSYSCRIGGLITGLIVHRFAPEAAEHGTDEVIEAYHHKHGKVPFKVSMVKMIASALTLATGGSGGKEGPIAQIGAGFGSFVSTRFQSLRAYRREIMLAGMAAGIGAIFRAPLAGAIFAAEILNSDMSYNGRVLIPAIIASSVSFGVYALYFGFSPVFIVPDFLYDFSLTHLLPFTILGTLAALGAILFIKVFYSMRNFFKKIPIKPYLKPALGGVLTGLVAMFIPEALGEGSLELARMLNGEFVLSALAIIFLAKMITTNFSIGSGGSGGIFGPSLFVGAALGGIFGGAYTLLFPSTGIPAVVFVLLGMVAFFPGPPMLPFPQ